MLTCVASHDPSACFCPIASTNFPAVTLARLLACPFAVNFVLALVTMVTLPSGFSAEIVLPFTAVTLPPVRSPAGAPWLLLGLGV